MLLILELMPTRKLIHLYEAFNMTESELIEDVCRALFSIDNVSNIQLFLKDIELMARGDNKDPEGYLNDAQVLMSSCASIPAVRVDQNDRWRYFKNINETTAVLYKGNFPISQDPPF